MMGSKKVTTGSYAVSSTPWSSKRCARSRRRKSMRSCGWVLVGGVCCWFVIGGGIVGGTNVVWTRAAADAKRRHTTTPTLAHVHVDAAAATGLLLRPPCQARAAVGGGGAIVRAQHSPQARAGARARRQRLHSDARDSCGVRVKQLQDKASATQKNTGFDCPNK